MEAIVNVVVVFVSVVAVLVLVVAVSGVGVVVAAAVVVVYLVMARTMMIHAAVRPMAIVHLHPHCSLVQVIGLWTSLHDC
jgi:hypothetical protein